MIRSCGSPRPWRYVTIGQSPSVRRSSLGSWCVIARRQGGAARKICESCGDRAVWTVSSAAHQPKPRAIRWRHEDESSVASARRGQRTETCQCRHRFCKWGSRRSTLSRHSHQESEHDALMVYPRNSHGRPLPGRYSARRRPAPSARNPISLSRPTTRICGGERRPGPNRGGA